MTSSEALRALTDAQQAYLRALAQARQTPAHTLRHHAAIIAADQAGAAFMLARAQLRSATQ